MLILISRLYLKKQKKNMDLGNKERQDLKSGNEKCWQGK
jgi:hypothetical protein